MVGGYRSIAKLGQGGMAEVRLALAQRSGGFNKLLVLKLLREDLSSDPEFLSMFLAEARIAALLHHPNIVQTNEVGLDNGRHFMAMEYLEGQSLSATLTRMGRDKFPLELSVYALVRILQGLHYAHELKDLDGTPLRVIHRDVSPQNVFLTYSGQIKLLDFGIAKIASANELTKNGIIKGKAGYIAPEQAGLHPSVDQRADIFSVGVLLWEAIAQRRFVPVGEAELTVLQRRLAGADAKLSDAAPNADPVLAEICNKSVAHDRADRFPDAQAFADALEGWLRTPKDTLEKQLGALMAELFAEERTVIRRLIEEETARPSTESGNLPNVPSFRGGKDEGSTAIATSATLALPSERRVTFRRAVVGGVAAACVLSALVFTAFRPRHKAAVPPRTDSSAPAGAPAIATEVALRVRSQPPTATLAIDDGPVKPMPFEGKVPHDDARHRLRFAADGYEPEERWVTFGNDLDMDVVLQRPPTPVASAESPKAQPMPVARPRPTAQPTAEAAPGRKAKHSIDEADPYGGSQ